MKKTVSITLHGQIFNLEEDAYIRLQNYLEEIKAHFAKAADMDAQEIIEDIEASLAEKFAEKVSSFKQAVNIKDVEELIALLGTVEDMDADGQADSAEKNTSEKSEEKKPHKFGSKLYRNPDDVVIAGVASGLAAYFGIDTVIVRVIFLVSLLAGGLGFWAYIALWIAMPVAETKAQKLEMQGEPLNLANLSSDSKKKVVNDEPNKENIQNLKNFDDKAKSVPKKVGGVIYTIFRVFTGLIGFAMLMAAWAGIVSVLFLTVVAFLDIRLPFFGSTAFFHHLFVGFPYVLIVLSLAAVILVPLFFLAKLALFCFNFKGNFSVAGIFFSLTLWILAVLVLGLAALDIGRTVEEKLIDFIETKESTYHLSIPVEERSSEENLEIYLLQDKSFLLDDLMGKKVSDLEKQLELFLTEDYIKSVDIYDRKIYIDEAVDENLEKFFVPVSGLSFLLVIDGEIVDYGVIWPLYSSLLYDKNGLIISYPFLTDEEGMYITVGTSDFQSDVFEYTEEDEARLLRVFEASAKLEK